jgi:hypothetical protein
VIFDRLLRFRSSDRFGSKPVILIVSISGHRWVGKLTSPRRAKSSGAVPYSYVGITGESCDEPRYHDE